MILIWSGLKKVRQAIKEFSDENKIKYEIVHERFAKFLFKN